MSFKFEILQEENAYILCLIGKITNEEDVSEVNEKIKNHLETITPNLIIDVTQLMYINSTGINLIMKALTKTRILNGDMVLFGVSGNVESLFKIAKLNEIYTIYPSKEEAVNHFKI